MKIYNRFTIGVVFDDEAKCDKLKERLENMIEDLDITKKEFKEGDDYYYELKFKCDSGSSSSSLVNGTRIRWDNVDDPDDDITLANFVDWLKNFPL